MYKRIATFLLVAVLLVFAIVSAVSAQFSTDVFVVDQSVVDGKVKISRAVINEPGWIVIHADNAGEIGPPIGQALLTDGINPQVPVAVDVDAVTDVLYAMLHVDAGEVGTYEFPDGPDVPLMVNDEIISPSFAVMGIENTIVGTAINAGGFETLVAAIEAADLVDTLQGDGPFTVFAPTDDAFAALPEGELDSLLEDTDALKDVILYHAVAGETRASDLENGMPLASIQGGPLTMAIDGDNATVNGVSIITTDIEAYNGIIHVIDEVLLPPNATNGDEAMEGDAAEGDANEDEGSESESDAEDGDTADSDSGEGDGGESEFGDIVETAIAAGGFNTLVAAIQASDLADTLKGDGPFTVLAPTDDAFKALPQDQLQALLAAPEDLANVLLYHVLPGTALSTDIADGLEVETAQGSSVTFGLNGNSATVDGANIVVTDILASNGVIHVLDAVILPPSTDEGAMEDDSDEGAMEGDSNEGTMEGDSGEGATEGDSDEGAMEGDSEGSGSGDIISIAAGSEDFSTLTAAITAAGLNVTLQGDGPFTVFAPTNAAFEKLPAGTVESLLGDRDTLTDILFYHVISGNLLSTGISDDLSVTTLQGTDVTFGVTGSGVTVNTANIVSADIPATNGIIHAIDEVLLPAGFEAPDPTPLPPTPVPIPTQAPTPVPTPIPNAPEKMPETGASFGSFGSTIPIVSLVLLALVGVAILERKKK